MAPGRLLTGEDEDESAAVLVPRHRLQRLVHRGDGTAEDGGATATTTTTPYIPQPPLTIIRRPFFYPTVALLPSHLIDSLIRT